MAPSVSSELLFVRNHATIQKRGPLRGAHRFAAAPLPHERRSLRPKALAELAAVGWRLDEYAKGKWEIGRPKASDRNAAPPV
ncbi:MULTISPECIES: replication protein C, IncQ-type [Serratia]|uniref:Replication protein C, IncQ-type n=1 Tax=Serratia marcescens TaxID=615 RepID=A0ABD5BIS1_SERMA|nr:replication protein C, IncQ-type [Serratia marcescens]MDQ9394741.1 replication protein C, IncQ-type [Serratia marcescens]MDQ9407499.1 replication protein C, IncQ-type [Serratia marcescens]MDQ9497311.1 replication protein C, IncQ-type [Serratia marcescens]MDQ9503211.1 replication protein C, IncQ-type [Serratia marcescens]MDQ9507681.1 replication protein C, IncQ-type [Serratia marcescens]